MSRISLRSIVAIWESGREVPAAMGDVALGGGGPDPGCAWGGSVSGKGYSTPQTASARHALCVSSRRLQWPLVAVSLPVIVVLSVELCIGIAVRSATVL